MVTLHRGLGNKAGGWASGSKQCDSRQKDTLLADQSAFISENRIDEGEDDMPAIAMNHFTILTDQLEETVKFYRELLELEPGDRPPFKFPGAWLYSRGQAVLHVIASDDLPENRAGVIDHMAFSAIGLIDTVEKLKSRKIKYELRRVSDSNPWQLFFHDPNGAKVELDFDPSESAPV